MALHHPATGYETLPMLAKTLADVRKRIERAGSKGLNEPNGRATLVEPVLNALGGDVHMSVPTCPTSRGVTFHDHGGVT